MTKIRFLLGPSSYIKLFTEVSKRATDTDRRDGIMQTTMFSRNTTSKFKTKHVYKVADPIF